MVLGLSVAKFGNTRRFSVPVPRCLCRDAAYVDYALWMEQHRIFRFIRYLPLLSSLTYRASSREVVHAPDNPQNA